MLCVFLPAVENQRYSFIPPVGAHRGSAYSITGEGRITAVRVWERYSNYISGVQFRYGSVRSAVAGQPYGAALEMALFDGEAITQLSGKYSYYLQSLVFATNMRRSLLAGRVSSAPTAIGTHWAVTGNGTAPPGTLWNVLA
ncbi:zymogen granule membrane protein 16-like [Salarias fasciatus]|uniref:zymogen granule membrane protein 16-like n=1 Tax=Salarias fasciatus TaxID=181472 RepID=UPI0011765FF3|nr:zymogen granule membrane protein 16-like [Salarias fasciatus]